MSRAAPAHARRSYAAERFVMGEGEPMLSWAVTFLIIAVIAGLLGFGGIAGTAVEMAKALFVVFLILSAVSLLFWKRAPRV
jgi:uncharacterized membrane protein YtjA (UPF0391 family)